MILIYTSLLSPDIIITEVIVRIKKKCNIRRERNIHRGVPRFLRLCVQQVTYRTVDVKDKKDDFLG